MDVQRRCVGNAAALAMPLQWVLYLNHGSPFRSQDTEFITDTRPIQGQHTGRTRGMSADDPGEYKYGVRIDDPINNLTLADDDPKLIVD